MKYVHDEDGLHDPAVRAAAGRFADGDGAAFLEAAAAVRAAAHAVERSRAAGAERRTLSSGAVDLLLQLSDGTAATIGELARAAGFSSRNVTGLADTLERAGMVTRAADPADRRAVLVSITEAGAGWVREFREPARMAMEAIFQGFTPDDVNRLRDLCLRVVVNQVTVAERTGASTSD